MAQVEPDELDLILMCTSTPDDLFGSGPQVIYVGLHTWIILVVYMDILGIRHDFVHSAELTYDEVTC